VAARIAVMTAAAVALSERPGDEAPSLPEVLRGLARERGRFVAFARRRVSTDADAEDVVQQAFARAAEKISTLRDPSSGVAWFYRVLRRLIAEQGARRALGDRKLGELGRRMDTATPEEAASCACALGVLDRLRPEYAEILRRVDLDDEPVDAAATALGITSNNASVRLHRARQHLRAEVESLCGPGEAAARRACADCDCPEPPKPQAKSATKLRAKARMRSPIAPRETVDTFPAGR
jgi:RNA polymerase sigma factor (sigma-70 family)